MRSDHVVDAFDRLDGWIRGNGWAGYDPYDIRGQTWYINLFGSWCPEKLKSALYLAELNLPQQFLRKVLRVKKQINAKGMGLLASAYLTRYETTGEVRYLHDAEEILEWLFENACRAYPGMSWGYPFHWSSRIFIPRGTPSVVVTGTVGLAVLQHYRISRSQQSYEALLKIAEFFTGGLNRPIDQGNKLCFSYTPLDQFTVLNASMFAASYLAQLSALLDISEFRLLALRAARYVTEEQNDDGSFYYWGSEPATTIDHFHTGFVLRFLDDVYRYIDADFVGTPLRRGFKFYFDHLFTDECVPKHTPLADFPINIHSCAEAILCLSQLGPEYGGFSRAFDVFRFTARHMRDSDGWYIAEIRRGWRGVFKINIPFVRWSESWMLLAFARLIDAQQRNSVKREELECESE